MLSLDGGRTYPVRVSPELEAREGGYRWRVPDLPAARARLMLRLGGEAGERAGALSREFRIVHAEGVPRPELGFHEGQLWTGLDPPVGPARAGITRDEPRLEDLADEVPLHVARAGAARHAPGARARAGTACGSRGDPARPLRRSRTP